MHWDESGCVCSLYCCYRYILERIFASSWRLCPQVLCEHSSGMLGSFFPSFIGVFGVYGDGGATLFFCWDFLSFNFSKNCFWIRERREWRSQPPVTSNLSTLMWCSNSLGTRRTSHLRRLHPSSAHRHTSTHTNIHINISTSRFTRKPSVSSSSRLTQHTTFSISASDECVCVLGSTLRGMPVGGGMDTRTHAQQAVALFISRNCHWSAADEDRVYTCRYCRQWAAVRVEDVDTLGVYPLLVDVLLLLNCCSPPGTVLIVG